MVFVSADKQIVRNTDEGLNQVVRKCTMKLLIFFYSGNTIFGVYAHKKPCPGTLKRVKTGCDPAISPVIAGCSFSIFKPSQQQNFV
jgi:hypothetical protein